MANILRFGLLISIQGMGWAIEYPIHAEILPNIDKRHRNQVLLNNQSREMASEKIKD